MDKIYRYMSFESFVDTILRKQLIFVHPSLLEDPFELHYFHQRTQNRMNRSQKTLDQEFIGSILEKIIANKLYIQSWSKLDESDALWRIYSHSGTSVRIEVDRGKISLLNDVKILDITYEGCSENYDNDEDEFYKIIGIKRKAFIHENEVRLIKHYKFIDTDDANKHLTAYLALNGPLYQYFEKIEIDDLKEEINRLVKFINQNLQCKTIPVSFEKVDNFLESAMLNPFAPDWVNDTLELFCKQYGVKYLGKSKLYKE